MKLEEGEIIELDDHKDYLVLKKISFNNNDYVSLVTMEKPTKMIIRKEMLKLDQIILEELSNDELNLILPLMKK